MRLELGLALAAYMQPEAYDLLDEAVVTAATPVQRGAIALRGARALGLAGHFDKAIELCRHGLRHAAGIPPELVARLDAELIANLWLQAPTVGEAEDRLRRTAASPPPVDLWRINAAWEASRDGRPVDEARTLLASALDALADETDSILGTFAKMTLIANGHLDAAREHCTALIEIARPRGWLIALAHGSLIRATALVQAGQILDAEADARLSFDTKLAISPPAALLWSLCPLVDALVEADDLPGADEALTAAGQQGAPPAGALSGPTLLQSRARLRLAQHRAQDALADALAAGARARELSLQHPVIASWRAEAVEALLVQGHAVRARQLAREQLELSERLGTPAARRRRAARARPPRQRADPAAGAARLPSDCT